MTRAPFLLLVVAAAACSSTASGPPAAANGGNGVDDVKQACVLTSEWQSSLTSDCVLCRIKATLAPCSCDPDPDRGACLMQEQAVTSQPDCSMALSMCIAACKQDCGCTDACYAGHDACRSVAAARDGCVVAVCDAKCK